MVMLGWAICYPMITLSEPYAPIMLTATLRAVFAGILLIVVAVLFKRPVPKTLRDFVYILAIGLTATSLGFWGMFYAGTLVAPGLATVISNTQPLIAAVNIVYYQNILVDSVAFGDLFCWFSKKWISTMGGDKEFEESQNECNDADEDEQQDCEANLDQCPALPGGAFKVLFVITPIVLVMNVHFCFVLFTHYKNSKLPASQGGCDDAAGPEYEDFDDEN